MIVVLSANTLVIMLHGALTPAAHALAAGPAGAARVLENHRPLFADSFDPPGQECRSVCNSLRTI